MCSKTELPAHTSHPACSGNPNRNSSFQQAENKISSQASPAIARASAQLSSVQLLSGVAPVNLFVSENRQKGRHLCPDRALIS